MDESGKLTIDIRSYWHSGSGRGSGSHLDAVTDRDSDGLPYLPGRTLKGLLRDAAWRLECWQSTQRRSNGLTVEKLFGNRGGPRQDTTAGVLRIYDARLPESLRAWLKQEEQAAKRAELYRELFETAIASETGVARSKSLRGMEVVVPLMLEARIDSIGPVEHWKEWLRPCLSLVRAVGAHRTRGLGRAVLTLE